MSSLAIKIASYFVDYNKVELGYFTPIQYTGDQISVKEYIFNGIEDYFSLGNRQAIVINGRMEKGSQSVVLDDSKKSSMLLTAVKVISYMTIIIPLIMLVAKVIFRSTHEFHTVTPKTLHIENYHREKGITGREKLVVDPNTLGLDLSETGTIRVLERREENVKIVDKQVTMGEVVGEVIEYINNKIENSNKDSVQRIRSFPINFNDFFGYSNLGLSDSDYDLSKHWMFRICKALEEKGHIYNVTINGGWIDIQA